MYVYVCFTLFVKRKCIKRERQRQKERQKWKERKRNKENEKEINEDSYIVLKNC